jgi:hypothetical protein
MVIIDINDEEWSKNVFKYPPGTFRGKKTRKAVKDCGRVTQHSCKQRGSKIERKGASDCKHSKAEKCKSKQKFVKTSEDDIYQSRKRKKKRKVLARNIYIFFCLLSFIPIEQNR